MWYCNSQWKPIYMHPLSWYKYQNILNFNIFVHRILHPIFPTTLVGTGPWWLIVVVPFLSCTLVDIRLSFIGSRLKNELNKFNQSSINSIFQLRTVEAETFNSHVIKKILDSNWLRGRETIPIMCACTFGIGRIGRISNFFLRRRCICTNNPQFGRKRPRHLVGYCIDGWVF